MVKLFFVTHTYSLGGGGGSEAFVSGFLKKLSENNEIFVFTPEQRNWSKEEKEYNIQSYKTPIWGHHGLHKFEQQFYKRKAARLADIFKAEVVHAQNDVLSGFVADYVKKKTDASFVLNIEYLSEQAASKNMKLVYWLNKHYLNKLNRDFTVCWSEHVMNKYLLPWGFKKSEIEIIPGAVDTELYNPNVNGSNINAKYGENLIVSAKPLHKTNAKGIENTIRAMPKVFKYFPDYKFLIFGDGSEKLRLKEFVKTLGLKEKVFFPGHLEYTEVPKVYAAAKLVVHSFAFEATTSIALMESMACKKPVIVTATGEIKKTVGKAGWIIHPNSSEEMAHTIIYALNHPREMNKRAKLARERIVNEYSYDSAVKKFNRIYNMLA